ncbi:unnamed protein product, partial [Mesorhabditis belari]|uniref:Uncharacterized protein n=1 Tax=Mesorhabditis belari TaxID=2138241 RepID=A0AAF3FN74_9BILA
MKASDENDAMVKCPEQFIDWATCMQNLNASVLPDGRIQPLNVHVSESALGSQMRFLIRDAITCFNNSKSEPRGAESEEEFTGMRCVSSRNDLSTTLTS